MLNFISKKSTTHFDAVFVGFYGQPLVPVLRKITDLPIIFDAFLSTYDTLCLERKSFKVSSPLCWLFHRLDKRSSEMSDVVLLDTQAHIDFFTTTFNVGEKRFRRVIVGADDEVFFPRGLNKKDGIFTVFFHGTYRPLQGIDVILRAAELLNDQDEILFRLIGKGPEKKKIMGMARDKGLTNVEFIDWVPYTQLPLQIEMSDLCLGGHFSNHDKAKRVIAGKTFQYLAMRRPVIVGDNPANRELFQDRRSVWMVEHNNPQALADAILTLKSEPQTASRIAEEGYRIYRDKCTPEIIGKELKDIIKEVVGV